MKIPLDYVCVKSGLLCNRCQSLVDSDQVEPFEVELMRILIELEEKDFKELREVEYHKAYKLNDLVVLIISSPQYISQSRLIKLAKVLQEKLKSKVRILEKSNNIKSTAIQLLSPVRVLGVNTIWLPDGSVQYVIRISKSEKRFLPADTPILETILGKLHSTAVKIRVE